MDDSFTELMMKIGMQDLVERLWFMEIMIRIDAQVTQGLKYLSFFHKAEKRSQILPPFFMREYPEHETTKNIAIKPFE